MQFKNTMHEREIIDHLSAIMRSLRAMIAPTCVGTAIDRCYIAGGAIASLVQGEVPADYDIWFHTIDDWQEVVSHIAQMPKKKTRYSWTYELPNGAIIQLVKSRLGTPEAVTGTFDFKHTQSYFFNNELKCDREFILSKTLTFVRGNLCHPVNTIQRVLKFNLRGYAVNGQCLADIMNEAGAEYAEAHTGDRYFEDDGTCSYDHYHKHGTGDAGSR